MSEFQEYLLSRRTIPSVNLSTPAPDVSELETLFTIACRVPDHGKLAPWRFIVYPSEKGGEIGETLAARWLDQNPDAPEERLEQERMRFKRAPMVIGVVSVPVDSPKVPRWEQELSAGAVCMNMLHGARALGYSAQWLTEWFAFDQKTCTFLGLGDGEAFAGFIHIGTPQVEPFERPRPVISDHVTRWGDA